MSWLRFLSRRLTPMTAGERVARAWLIRGEAPEDDARVQEVRWWWWWLVEEESCGPGRDLTFTCQIWPWRSLRHLRSSFAQRSLVSPAPCQLLDHACHLLEHASPWGLRSPPASSPAPTLAPAGRLRSTSAGPSLRSRRRSPPSRSRLPCDKDWSRMLVQSFHGPSRTPTSSSLSVSPASATRSSVLSLAPSLPPVVPQVATIGVDARRRERLASAQGLKLELRP